MARRSGSFPCPVCGERVPAGAKVCRECGSDETTGWSEDTLYDDLDLPDPGYAAEDFLVDHDALSSSSSNCLRYRSA